MPSRECFHPAAATRPLAVIRSLCEPSRKLLWSKLACYAALWLNTVSGLLRMPITDSFAARMDACGGCDVALVALCGLRTSSFNAAAVTHG